MSTNMYKNITDTGELNNLYDLLADLSIGDSMHDFGHIKDANLRIKTTDFKSIKPYYDKGIPVPTNPQLLDESELLTKVMKELKDENATENKLDSSFTYMHDNMNNHSLVTINNYSYNVSKVLVEEDEEKEVITTTSVKLFENLPETDVDIAVVIDAVSVSFLEIAKNGDIPTDNPRKNIYYIYGPEVINDPATKTPVDSKIFLKQNEDKGVNLVPCLPSNASNFIYEYDFDKLKDLSNKDNYLYLNEFFSNYQFNLSEVQENKMGKSSDYITNLNIKYLDENNILQSNILPDSKKKNDINILASPLRILVNLFSNLSSSSKSISDKLKQFFSFKNKKENAENTVEKNNFLMNSGFQQKRSGDWLQVLLCAALKDKSRPFYNFITKDKANITKNIQRVFLVTHDRIALAFALLNGVDVIFTHKGSSGKKAFFYTISSKDDMDQSLLSLLKNYKSQTIDTKISSTISLINDYQINGNYNIYVTNNDKNLNLIIDKFTNLIKQYQNNPASIMSNKTTFQKQLNDGIRDIFSVCLINLFYKQLVPNLQSLKEDLEKIDFAPLLSNVNAISEITDLNDQNREYVKTFVQTTSEAKSKISNANTILENVENTFSQKNIGVGYKKPENEALVIVKQFKKSINYINASSWDWDNTTLGKRQWTLLNNIMDGKNYKSDRNIFLYNLSKLDDNVKKNITFLYYSYYKLILDNYSISDKFKAVSLSFCVEVLLTLGGNGTTDTSITSEMIIDTMNDFLTKPNNIYTDEKENISENNPYLSDYKIVEEDSEFQIAISQNNYIGSGIASEFSEDIQNINDNNFILSNSQSQEIENEINNSSSSVLTKRSLDESQSTDTSSVPFTNMSFNTNQATESVMTLILCSNWKSNLSKVLEYIIKKEQNQEQNGGGSSTSISKVEQLQQFLSLTNNNLTNNNDYKIPEDIFVDTSICFHPLLPIYMIVRSYYTTICNENIFESWDMKIFLNVYVLLKNLKEYIIQSYSGENNSNLDKSISYILGLGVREIIFLSDNTSNNLFTKISDPVYKNISNLLQSLSYRISGKIYMNNEPSILEISIMKDLLNTITISSIPSINTMEDYDNFKKTVFDLFIEIGNKIVEDRKNGIISSLPVLSLESKPESIGSQDAEAIGSEEAQGSVGTLSTIETVSSVQPAGEEANLSAPAGSDSQEQEANSMEPISSIGSSSVNAYLKEGKTNDTTYEENTPSNQLAKQGGKKSRRYRRKKKNTYKKKKSIRKYKNKHKSIRHSKKRNKKTIKKRVSLK